LRLADGARYDAPSAMSDRDEGSAIFPKWLDSLRPAVGLAALLVPAYALALLYYGGSPTTTDVGYRPEQPVPYSHALHAGDLGIDCRYCHNTVERSAHASIPATETCMNCHKAIHPESPKLLAVRESLASGKPVRWVRVHDLPDYAYFDHSAHVRRGVGCVECHGRVDRMEVVYQARTLSMGWCLHRDPEPHLRPLDQITNMAWDPTPAERREIAHRLREEWGIAPSEDCSTCHR
jgi:hypothetical protein